eukprot:g4232.t1
MIGLVLSLLCAWPGASLALEYWTGEASPRSSTYAPLASFGRVPSTSGEAFELTQIVPFDACTVLDPRMSPVLRGKALLVQRGGCSFVRKACMVQASGAAAMVVYNSFETDASSAGRPEQQSGEMQVSPINYPIHIFGISTEIAIPVVMVSSIDGIKLNQGIMHGSGAVKVNISVEAPPGKNATAMVCRRCLFHSFISLTSVCIPHVFKNPASCGAWDRWPDDPIQCNSRASQDISNRVPLQPWLASRSEAAFYVTGDVEMARIIFTIGCVLCVLVLIPSMFRPERLDAAGVRIQTEQTRRLFSISIAFCASLAAAVSYGIDQWGGECESDHVATVFLFQRLASTLCVILYLFEIYYVIGAPLGHTNPYLDEHARSLPNACGRAWVKMEVAVLLLIEAWIAGQYASKERSYATFSMLSAIRICLHAAVVMIAHCGGAQHAYQSVFIKEPRDRSVPEHVNKRFRFRMLAQFSVVSSLAQAVVLSVAILQQAYFVFGAGSLDFPAEF